MQGNNQNIKTGKTAAIRRIVVVSRHHGEKLRAPLKHPVHYSIIELRGLRGPLNFSPNYAEIR